MTEVPFSTLLYRYFFFHWLFRNPDLAPDASLFERAAIQRHNRRQAAWLPVYLLRWLWSALILYGLAKVFEVVFDLPAVGHLLFGGGVLCGAFAISIGVTWVGLRHEAAPNQ